MPVSRAHKNLRNILHCYPYKITNVKEFLLVDLPVRPSFSLEFLDGMEVNNYWPWNIFETHFSRRFFNTQNCRIWATKNPLANAPIPFHSAKVTVWCGLTASFIE
ncbi:uncharacterized protein CEXT_523141 [Caerostris extrusa]|uniref:Uncharacterized protein n=1 Tax=Caerostris extrusa TaxID=172846 RepID=A0AAV4PER8_CAEEX|nr:uncharacterized protein CEXT_523141 [Caerostris extrusa]